MMKRSTVILMTHAALGGGLMMGAAALLGQAATPAVAPEHALPAQIISLLGPSASGVAGALVVALYNKVAAYEKRIQALERFASTRPCVRPPGLGNPDEPLEGLIDRPCPGGECEEHAHRRRGRQ